MEKQELSCSERRNVFEQEKKTLCELLNVIELCIKFKDGNMFYFYLTILKAIVESLRINACIDKHSDNTVYFYVFKLSCDYAEGKYIAACWRLNQLKSFIRSEDFGNDDGC